VAFPGSEDKQALESKLSFAKKQENEALVADLDVAAQYADGDMLADVETALEELHRAAQEGTAPEGIQATIIPLVERFLDETANAYAAGGVVRKLVGEDGVENEEESQKLTDHLSRIGFDQTRNTQERYAILLKSSGVVYQANAENDALDPVVFLPQDINPILPKDPEFSERVFNPTDTAAYQGFVLKMRIGADADSVGRKRDRFVFMNAEEVVHFVGRDSVHVDSEVARTDNPYGVLTLSIWHTKKPVRKLIPMVVPSIFIANRALNVAWSLMLDVVRFQGGATMIKSIDNPEEAGARVAVGVRTPMVVGSQENAGYFNAGNDYTGIAAFLQTFARFIAMANRLSPNEFSLDATQAASGFAKQIDNLPKTEGRVERIEWFSIMEERDFEIYGPILRQIGVLGEASKGLRLRVEFPDPVIVRSVDEEIKEAEFRIKTGLDSVLRMLMREHGISEEEAEEMLEKNKASMAQPQQQPPNLMSNDRLQRNAALTRIIGARNGERQVNGASPRPDRQRRGPEG